MDRVLSIIMVVAIIGALGVLGYVTTTPKAEDSLTEFYILGLDGTATDYPGEVKVGEEAKVMAGNPIGSR